MRSSREHPMRTMSKQNKLRCVHKRMCARVRGGPILIKLLKQVTENRVFAEFRRRDS